MKRVASAPIPSLTRAFSPTVALLLTLFGCAGTAPVRRHPPGVPVESRPSPPSPTTSADTGRTGGEIASRPPVPVESVMTPDERRAALTRIAADSTAASTAVRRCASRKLLPDQESVFDATRGLLDQVRAALARDEVWRAESLARKARQLAASLDCPG